MDFFHRTACFQHSFVESLGSTAAPIKLWKMYAFVGTLLAISLLTLPTINLFWKQSPNGFIPAMNYGCKTGLTGSRFCLLLSDKKFNDPKQSVASTGDRFCKIRYLVSHFNTTMGHFLTAGWVLCLDELMCQCLVNGSAWILGIRTMCHIFLK